MLAKKWILGADEHASVLRLNVQANFPEQSRAQSGPLTSYIAMRSLPDGLFSGLFRKRATANPFTWATCYSWSSKGNTSTTVWQKIRSVLHFLQPPAIDKEPQSNAKNVCKSKGVTRWREFESTYCITSISAWNTGTWAFFCALFSTIFCLRIFLKRTGID